MELTLGLQWNLVRDVHRVALKTVTHALHHEGGLIFPRQAVCRRTHTKSRPAGKK